jgi:hypothetical protein
MVLQAIKTLIWVINTTNDQGFIWASWFTIVAFF